MIIALGSTRMGILAGARNSSIVIPKVLGGGSYCPGECAEFLGIEGGISDN